MGNGGAVSERQGFFSRRRLIIFGDVALVVIVLVGVVSYFITKSTTCDFPLTMQIQPPLEEIVHSPTIRETPPPWPAEPQGLEARMAAAKVAKAPTGKAETTFTFRLHVYYKGQAVEIPSGIGHGSGFVASIHTDDGSGTIHVDRNNGDPELSLGDVFAVWGVRMTANSLGDACNQGNSVLRLFTGGTPLGGDIGVQPLSSSASGATYTLAFGTDAELPAELRAKLAPEQRMPPQHPSKSPG
jgi:hypothetical protein